MRLRQWVFTVVASPPLVAALVYLYLTSDRGILALLSVLLSGAIFALLPTRAYLLQTPPSVTLPNGLDTAQKKLSQRFTLTLGLVLIIYLCVGLVRAVSPQWDFAPDTLSYLQIARQYANGIFVIRGYWSPMLSWATAIVMQLGITPELALWLATLIAGAVGIVLCAQLGRQIGMGYLSRLAVVIAAAILVLYTGLVSSDVLGMTVLLGYLCVVTNEKALKYPLMYGAMAGLIGGAAYLARSYNLTYILAHLVMFLFLGWLRTRSFKAVGRFFPAFIVALLIMSGPWVYLLSERYGKLTFSTSALHTRGLVAPGSARVSSIVCFSGERLCGELEDILFPWEDHPVEIQPQYNWSPFSSGENFRHQLWLILDNIRYFARLNFRWTLLGMIFGVGVIVFWRDTVYRERAIFLLLSALIYIGGYMLTLSSGGIRYFLIPYLLIFMGVFLTIERVSPNLDVRARGLIVLGTVLLFALSFVTPVSKIASTLGGEPATVCAIQDAEAVGQYLTAPFASIDGRWKAGMDIAYFTQTRTVGHLSSEKLTIEVIDAQLRENRVTSVIVYSDSALTDEVARNLGYLWAGNFTFCDQNYRVYHLSTTD